MIFRGPFADVAIPEVPVTSYVFQNAKERGDKPALIDGTSGRVLTYSQLTDSISRVAASLARRGFKKGDVFGILSPNVPEYAIAFHAVASLGGIACTVNPLYTEPEIAHQLKDSGSRFLVTVSEHLAKANAAAIEANIEELFVFDSFDADVEAVGAGGGATPFSALLESDGKFTEVEIDPREDLVALPYSSGTTGLPKGVMLTHHNLVANMCQMEGLSYFSDKDTLISILPMFHIYGLVVVLNLGLRQGATIVTLPRFELEPFLRALQKVDRVKLTI